jgi:hypothetical protein
MPACRICRYPELTDQRALYRVGIASFLAKYRYTEHVVMCGRCWLSYRLSCWLSRWLKNMVDRPAE